MIESDVLFNISDFEYITYLECPFKFYMLKNNNKSELSYNTRLKFEESSNIYQERILWLQWFKSFHKIYSNSIQNGDRPFLKSKENRIAALFYDFELTRYKKYPDFWFPLVQEVFICNEYYRGTIDRVDQLNLQGDCRIILYRTGLEKNLEEEMYFNTILLSHEQGRLPWFPRNGRIKEIGLYIYPRGELLIHSITDQEILQYESKLYNALKEILKPNLKRKRECNFYTTNCPFKEICKRMPL